MRTTFGSLYVWRILRQLSSSSRLTVHTDTMRKREKRREEKRVSRRWTNIQSVHRTKYCSIWKAHRARIGPTQPKVRCSHERRGILSQPHPLGDIPIFPRYCVLLLRFLPLASLTSVFSCVPVLVRQIALILCATRDITNLSDCTSVSVSLSRPSDSLSCPPIVTNVCTRVNWFNYPSLRFSSTCVDCDTLRLLRHEAESPPVAAGCREDRL